MFGDDRRYFGLPGKSSGSNAGKDKNPGNNKPRSSGMGSGGLKAAHIWVAEPMQA